MNYFKYLFLAIIAIVLSFHASRIQPAQAQLRMPSGNNAGLEATVRNFFIDSPDMITIAQCESGFRQYNNAGTVLLGGVGTNVGIFQINEVAHAATALGLGFDIYTPEGNMGYAKYLYQKQGVKPWASCIEARPVAIVSQSAPVSSSLPTSFSGQSVITANLSYGIVSTQVLLLQKILNATGATVAASGPGSLGNETTKFGQLTREAVKSFQCSKGIVCEGNESTTGYGYVGPRTRQALNALGL
jgi:hypothetical protein